MTLPDQPTGAQEDAARAWLFEAPARGQHCREMAGRWKYAARAVRQVGESAEFVERVQDLADVFEAAVGDMERGEASLSRALDIAVKGVRVRERGGIRRAVRAVALVGLPGAQQEQGA